MADDPIHFVTGGTGFIGSRLVSDLLRQGQRVKALSRRAQLNFAPGVGRELTPAELALLEIVPGDITDPDSVRRGMSGCTHVFHLAGYAKNYAPRRQTYWDINVAGLRNVLTAAREQNVQRVVWTSTMLTFGPTPIGTVAVEATPRSRPDCLTDYEASKVDAERLAAQFSAEGQDIVTVNPGRVYGPGHLTEGNALALLIDQYDRGRAPILLNLGRNVGNYVYVEDVVQGHLLAMQRGRAGEKYLLGGQNISLKEFFRAIDQISGKRHWQLPVFRFSALLFAYGHLACAKLFKIHPQITPPWVRTFLLDWAYSSAKAERELGYQITPLEDGLKITYEWLLAQRRSRAV